MKRSLESSGADSRPGTRRSPGRNRRHPALRSLLLLALLGGALPLAAALAPSPLPGLRSTNEFFPGTTYRASVPSPDRLLGFPMAERAATAAQIEQCLRAWTNAAPDRTRLVEYARSHEGRPLHYLVLTAPKNLERIDEIRAGLARLGDPRGLAAAEAEALIARLPAVGWLAYTIHGDETEGSDAALAVIYHLLASEDAPVERLLSDVVVIVDPLMNPDGRERFLKMVAEHRGTSPNVDDQSLLHRGYWPQGRGNHYLFDLNRDWIYGVHPESRGRIRAVAEWNPQLFVDAHGMGAQETHLFSPPREPINPNIPKERERWSELFARDQAAAFDREGLRYYTGEWNEEWYPGYANAWASYRGGVGILYEQARVAEDAVRRPGGSLLSYRDSVRHHVIGSMANLGTLAANAKELLRSYYRTRQEASAADGPYARRTFAFLPSANRARWNDLVELLRLQGFAVYQATQAVAVAEAADPLGRTRRNVTLPPGTLLVPNRQPLGHLVAAMLEFDPRLSEPVLARERQELLQKGGTRIYDVTAWNLPMMYDLPALTLATDLPAGTTLLAAPSNPPSPAQMSEPPAPVALVFDGADDRSVTAAARLLERGVAVRVAERPFRLDDRDFARGSVVVVPLDNQGFADGTEAAVRTVAGELGIGVSVVRSGLGPGEAPDIGAAWFRRVEPPRIVIVAREGVRSGDYGAVWHLIDHRLGIRHSQVPERSLNDLGRYNVLVIPEAAPSAWSANFLAQLKDWVKNGGTLIATGSAAVPLAAEKAEFSRVRLLPDVLGQLADYEVAVLREWQGKDVRLPKAEDLWSHLTQPGLTYPWPMTNAAFPDEKELKRRDAWQQIFMPQGAMVAGRVDTNHWLTFGCDEILPVLAAGGPVLMVGSGAQAVIRYGVLSRASAAAAPDKTEKPKEPRTAESKGAGDETGAASGDKREKRETPRVGWCVLPPETELRLRMSGLLWPEAAHRLANAAYLSREPLGRGQVILFAGPPAFRGASHGTSRLLLNAMVYGPGCGASPVIRP